MAEEKKHSRKLTFRELADKHGHEVDPSDLHQRSRNKRMLDNLVCGRVEARGAEHL